MAVIIPCLNFLCFFLCFKTKKEKAQRLETNKFLSGFVTGLYLFDEPYFTLGTHLYSEPKFYQ